MEIDGVENDFGLTFSGMIVPVTDMSASLNFYAGLGLEVLFRDADRWAALRTEAAKLSLAGGDQLPPSNGIELMFRVADAQAMFERVSDWDGAELVEGAHEWQVRLRDPSGNWIVLYSRKDADLS